MRKRDSETSQSSADSGNYASRSGGVEQGELFVGDTEGEEPLQPLSEHDPVEPGEDVVAVPLDDVVDEIGDETPVYSENAAVAQLMPDDEDSPETVISEVNDLKGVGQNVSHVYVPAEAVSADETSRTFTVTENDLIGFGLESGSLSAEDVDIDLVEGAPVPKESTISATEYARGLADDLDGELSSANSLDEELSSGAAGSETFSVRGDRAGGWPEFDPDALGSGEEDGNGHRSISKGEFEDTHVYVARGQSESDAEETVARERGAYAFSAALGASVPRHEFGSSERGAWTAKEDAGEVVSDAPDEWKARADWEEVRDTLAVQAMAGNWDSHDENYAVDESGNFEVIDLDRGCDDLDPVGGGFQPSLATWDTVYRYSAEIGEEFTDASRGEVSEQLRERSRELSESLIQSGEYERVVETVAEVDDTAAKHVAKNVAMLASGRDD